MTRLDLMTAQNTVGYLLKFAGDCAQAGEELSVDVVAEMCDKIDSLGLADQEPIEYQGLKIPMTVTLAKKCIMNWRSVERDINEDDEKRTDPPCSQGVHKEDLDSLGDQADESVEHTKVYWPFSDPGGDSYADVRVDMVGAAQAIWGAGIKTLMVSRLHEHTEEDAAHLAIVGEGHLKTLASQTFGPGVDIDSWQIMTMMFVPSSTDENGDIKAVVSYSVTIPMSQMESIIGNLEKGPPCPKAPQEVSCQ